VTHFKVSFPNSSGATEEVYEKHQQYDWVSGLTFDSWILM